MAIVLGPDEGRRLEARGSDMLFKATGATTGGRFSLMQRTLPPGGRTPPAHRHPDTVEAFLVLEGRLVFTVDGERVEGNAGAFVLVPEGAGHTFGNESGGPARVLIIHAPALDRYFEDLAALWVGAVPPARVDELALMRRHGLDPVEATD